MRLYGFLLEELTYKPGRTPQDVIDYINENEDEMPGQAEAWFDDNRENPYFAIVPVLTRSASSFEELSDANDFLVRTIAPFLNMEETDIRKTIGYFSIASTDWDE